MYGKTLLMIGIMVRGLPLLHTAAMMSGAGKEQSLGKLSHSFSSKHSTLSMTELCI